MRRPDAGIRAAWLLLAVLFGSVLIKGQDATTPVAFDVVSIRPLPGGVLPLPLRIGSGRLDGRATLEHLIQVAYSLAPYEKVVGPPTAAPVLTQGYEVIARAPASAALPSRASTLAMMRQMLSERFRLRVRMDSVMRAASVLRRLSPDTLGPGLRPFGRECKPLAPGTRLDDPRFDEDVRTSCSLTIYEGRVRGTAETMASFTGLMSLAGQHPIVDQTGLVGRFQIDLTFSPDSLFQAWLRPDAPGWKTDAPSFRDAVRDQLGLAMRSEQHAVRVAVIEQVDALIAN